MKTNQFNQLMSELRQIRQAADYVAAVCTKLLPTEELNKPENSGIRFWAGTPAGHGGTSATTLANHVVTYCGDQKVDKPRYTIDELTKDQGVYDWKTETYVFEGTRPECEAWIDKQTEKDIPDEKVCTCEFHSCMPSFFSPGNHHYILTSEQGHRVIKCLKCGYVKPV